MALFGPPNVERLKQRRNLKGLLKALSYRDDAKVRKQAAEALGGLKDAQALPQLLSALDDDEPGVRVASASALGEIGDDRALEPLRAMLIAGLGQGGAQGEPLYEAIVQALGSIGGEGAVEALRGALDTEMESVREAAETSLEALGEPPDVKHWIAMGNWDKCVEIGDSAVDALVDVLGDHELRDGAMNALAGIGLPAVKPLIEILRIKDAVLRNASTAVLANIGKPAVRDLIQALKDDELCGFAASLLGDMGDADAAQPLIETLAGCDHQVRINVYEALAKIGDAGTVELFTESLKDEDSDIRIFSASALGRIRDSRAVEPLIGVLADEERDVCLDAARALGEIGDERAVQPLIDALKQGFMEEAAAEALGKIGDLRALEPLRIAVEETPSHIYPVAKEPYEKLLKISAERQSQTSGDNFGKDE